MAKVTLSYPLCDTRYDFSYEDYEEFCDINDIEPQGEDSEDYYDYVAMEQMSMWDDLLVNLKHCKETSEANQLCIILGNVGLWYGNREIVPVVCPNVREALIKCLGSCDDIDAKMVNGVINVNAYHHDGTNSFEIYKLSKKGQEVDFDNCNEIKDYYLAKYHNYLF